MSKSTPFYISIPAPCSEDWDSMKKEHNGKFCSNCQKTVVDFSHLSDGELYNYFKTLKTIPCGRFHKSQLNIPIVSINRKKKSWINFYRSIGAILAFFTIKNSTAAPHKKEVPITNSPSWKNASVIYTNGDKIIISGGVKDMFNQPIENAEVWVDGIMVAKSDKKGDYEFELKDGQIKSFILTISSPGLVTAIRNYHPVMLSTAFNVTLFVPNTGGYSLMGMPFISRGDLPVKAVCFKKNIKVLDDDTKATLSLLAQYMRNWPDLVIKIVAYPPLIQFNASRQDVLKNHLINQEGVSPNRIILIMETKSKKEMSNTLEIMAEEQ